MRSLLYPLFLLFLNPFALAKDINLNQVTVYNAPDWLSSTTVQSVVDRVQNYLEWDLRKLSVFYHSEPAAFNQQHQFNFGVNAFFRKSDSTIHLSPQVSSKNFSQVFGHELVHALFFQKYQKAIPIWLEEGLANTIAQYPSPNYQWLKSQSWPSVSTMGHVTQKLVDPKVYYSVSTAIIEMIREKCDLHELLKLAVGSQFTDYLKTFCGIEDLDKSFNGWVGIKAESPAAPNTPNIPWWKKDKQKPWWKKGS